MTEIIEVLRMVGFDDSPEIYEYKEIKLRNGVDAVLWVNKLNGHGILDPKFWIEKKDYENEYRKTFSANLNNKTHPEEHCEIYRSLNYRQFQQIYTPIQKASNLLEIGSSFGGVLKLIDEYVQINNKNFSITSIEPNKEDAEYIKKKFADRVQVHNTFFTDKTDLGKKFDLIISFEVLEHIEKPNDFVKGIYNNLKIGGVVNIEVPNHHDSMLHVFKNEAYTNFYYHKAHIHYFTPTSLKDMFAKHGINGKSEGFQMYPATNQLFWMFNNKPQSSAIEALNLPECIKTSTINIQLEEVFDKFINEYNKVVDNNLVSDCLVFKGIKE